MKHIAYTRGNAAQMALRLSPETSPVRHFGLAQIAVNKDVSGNRRCRLPVTDQFSVKYPRVALW